MKKRIISIISCFTLLFSLTACGEKIPLAKAFDKAVQTAIPENTLMIQNSNYKLELNKETLGVVLTDLSTGLTWGTSPVGTGDAEVDELGMPIKKHPLTNSVLSVTYLDYETNTENEILSYNGAVNNGRVRCAIGKNSILVEFYFDTPGFMIPVEYILEESSVKIQINPSLIQEGENQILKVAVAPFWCSVENNSEDTYLFVPSGSGALVDASVRSQQGSTYTSQVYGEDLTIKKGTQTTLKESVRLPVYGVRHNSNQASFAIIDGGSDSAAITVRAGSTALGYTTVYGVFQIRGYTDHIAQMFAKQTTETKVYTRYMISTPLSISFFPLIGENANYSGMAGLYKNYLKETENMTEVKEEKNINLTVLGGTLITESVLGIPKTTLYSATTLKEATKIVEDLHRTLGISFNVNLKGYGTSGVNIGKIAGGYKIGSTLGTQKDLSKLKNITESQGSALFMDFELNRFSKSGGGVSTIGDACYNAGEQKAVQYLYNVAVGKQEDKTRHYILTPYKLESISEKLLKKTKSFALDGLSLESLSSLSYSDYFNEEDTAYYSKSEFSDTALKVFKNIASTGRQIMSSKANVYAAVMSDVVINAPSDSDNDAIFKCDVPFYQMVFKGYIPLATESINFAESPEKLVLKAIEGGMSLGFTVAENWDNKLIDADYPLFYNSLYEDVKGIITSSYEEMKDYYSLIGGAEILSHTVLDNGLRQTVFSNGVTVYVNLNDSATTSPAGEISPLDYLVLEKAE